LSPDGRVDARVTISSGELGDERGGNDSGSLVNLQVRGPWFAVQVTGIRLCWNFRGSQRRRGRDERGNNVCTTGVATWQTDKDGM
jgi:hypothetical protein